MRISLRSILQSSESALGSLFELLLSLYGLEFALLAVVFLEGFGLLVIGFQSAENSLGLVVLA